MRRLKIAILSLLFIAGFSHVSFANRIDSLDITHYNLSLSMRNISSKQISGNTTITAYPKFNGTKAVTLDLLKLDVDSIYCNKKLVSYTQTDSTIRIQLDKIYYLQSPEDSFKLQIFYHGSPSKDAIWGGFFFSGDYAFNMGVGMGSNPPNFGRCWFPCLDNFIDRATYEFHITTDTGYMAVCSGIQEPAILNENGSITWNWRLAQTIPTYLANVAVSKYVLINSSHMGLYREIPIVLAVAAADTSKAKASFFRLSQAIKCFEERFGPYLFDRVGYVGVPFNAGAMEHACNISYPLYAVDGSSNYETLMAHELAHSWFGNLVTTRTASDMWLNEGWASYCEALFLECAYGRKAYDEKISSELFEYLRWAHARDGGFLPVSGVPLAQTYGTHVYTKGGMMLHTLRGVMGDSAFFRATKKYLKSLAFQNTSSTQMMNAFVGFGSLRMSDFFDTWIFEPGDVDMQLLRGGLKNNELFIYQQRRHRHKIHGDLGVYGSIYLYNGLKRIFGEYLDKQSDGWNSPIKTGFILDSTDAFAVLNEDNGIALAKTNQKEWIKSTGLRNFSDALFTFNVQEIHDSALMYVEHHFAGPYIEEQKYPKGVRVSKERYWHITGIWKRWKGDQELKIRSTAFFNYDGSTPTTRNSGYLDNELIVGSEDSIVLLYRPNTFTPFTIETDLTFQPGASKIDKVGRFWVNNLKQGDYVLGYRDMGASTSEIKGDRRKMLLYPNPTEGLLNLELPEQHETGTLKICDAAGKILKEWQVNHKENKLQINTSIYPQGMFYLIFEDNKGKITQSFMVK